MLEMTRPVSMILNIFSLRRSGDSSGFRLNDFRGDSSGFRSNDFRGGSSGFRLNDFRGGLSGFRLDDFRSDESLDPEINLIERS
jgi:hypothetical protein